MKFTPKKENARKFTVSEIIDVPYDLANGIKRINKKQARKKMKEFREYTDERGCYVFGIRAGKGCTPIYVGKAAKQALRTEVFSADKLEKFNNALFRYRKGTPVVAFVVPEKKRGVPPASLIDEMEGVLIQRAYAKNRKIENENGIYLCGWFIAGAINRGKGKPTEKSKAFCQLVGID